MDDDWFQQFEKQMAQLQEELDEMRLQREGLLRVGEWVVTAEEDADGLIIKVRRKNPPAGDREPRVPPPPRRAGSVVLPPRPTSPPRVGPDY